MIAEDKYELIRKLEIKSKLLAGNISAGIYASAFKGNGLDYKESRLYEQGDDIKKIDSRLSARLNHLYVKTFEEERQLNFIIMVDVSSSMQVAASSKLKLAAEIAALIAGAAYLNNDKVGVMIFNDEVLKFTPPNRQPDTIAQIIYPIFSEFAKKSKTNIAKALRYLFSAFSEKAVLIVLSDFLCDEFKDELKIAAERFDTILFYLQDDEIPSTLKNIIINAQDSENDSDHSFEICDSHTIERKYFDTLKSTSLECAVDLVTFDKSKAYHKTLIDFLNIRKVRY